MKTTFRYFFPLTVRLWPSPLVCAMLVLLGVAVPKTFASGALHVENYGADGPTCGRTTAPCRSISRAIANASDGDRIVVGPGRYGDLNRNGTVEPGEEAAEAGFGCDCLIKLNKRVRLESSDGAGATLIDQGSANVPNSIRIQVSGVVVGKENKGFTFNRLLIIDNGTSDVTVMDNVASASDGLFVNGSGHNVIGNVTPHLFVEGSSHTIRENFATGGPTGILFHVRGSGHVVTGNLANGPGSFVIEGNGHRIHENTTRTSGGLGFSIDGTGHVFTGNVVSGSNGNGVEVQGSDHLLTENVITGVGSVGLQVSGSGHVIRRNAVLSNPGFGLYVYTSAVTITENNIFGNSTNVTVFGSNCGLLNTTGASLSAPNNFWDASSGPGPDPADAVCDDSPSTTIVEPVAKKPYNIPVRAGR